MLIKGHINHLCGETPTSLRMDIPAPTTNFAGPTVMSLTETQCKAAINSRCQSGRDVRELKDWPKAQPERFAMLGTSADSYDSVVWVT
jgi:hypothetical protein